MVKKELLKGLFFCIEGLDGSGKSTQIQLLNQRLCDNGYNVDIIREPGGCALSEEIREILLLKKDLKISSISELLLFMASRYQLIEEVLLPKLEQRNQIILADRFVWSTIAYQGYGRSLSIKFVKRMCKMICRLAMPHHTFLLKISLEQMKERLKDQAYDRMESQGSIFFGKVMEGYDACVRDSMDHSTVISAMESPKVIADLIWNKIQVILNDRMC